MLSQGGCKGGGGEGGGGERREEEKEQGGGMTEGGKTLGTRKPDPRN